MKIPSRNYFSLYCKHQYYNNKKTDDNIDNTIIRGSNAFHCCFEIIINSNVTGIYVTLVLNS